jgi:ribosomal protein S18 acetylase RimI-like enzyme
MKIRQAEVADIEAMSLLLDQLFSIEQDFSPDKDKQDRGLRLLLESEDAVAFVAEEEARVIGMATLQILISTAEGGRVGLIEDVVVDTGYRGRGVGNTLLSHLLQWAEKNGLKRVQLLADCENQPALDFYQKEGWTLTCLQALKKGLSNLS